ncbi:hypothetical protein N9Y81_02655, partial [Akkermansiaceae bacterium]|nr:hypothetical protein [Akkermansiaceae bacterium]
MSTYDSYEPRSNFGLFVFLAFVAAALLGTGVYLFQASSSNQAPPPKTSAPEKPEGEPVVGVVEPKPFDP